MKITEVIKELRHAQKKYGDIEVYVKPSDIAHPFSSDLTDEYKYTGMTIVGIGTIETRGYFSWQAGDIQTVREHDEQR